MDLEKVNLMHQIAENSVAQLRVSVPHFKVLTIQFDSF
jgi:hypothetical protein